MIYDAQKAKIVIEWVDTKGITHKEEFNERTLEDAETIIGLMTGNISLSDLEN